MNLGKMPVENYLAVLASSEPAPGGGSASALAGAQGAGLVAMAANLTLGRKKYAAFEASCTALATSAQALMDKLTAQIQADTQAFCLVAQAMKLPKDDPQRPAAMEAATLTATKVPLETMELGLQGLEYARQLAEGFNTNAASDLGVGAWQLLSCVEGAWLNVQINLPGLSGEAARESYREKGLEILQKVRKLQEEIAGKIQTLL